MAAKVSGAVIRRLPRYYQLVVSLCDQGVTRISSAELAEMLGFTASQVRQDFSCFGGFGHQGYGYSTAVLRERLAGILNLREGCRGVVVGAGELARSLFSDQVFRRGGVEIIAFFDARRENIGAPIGELTVRDARTLEAFCADRRPDIAVLTGPAENAMVHAAILGRCGVRGIWNFTAADLPGTVGSAMVENVHLADSLMTLCCRIPARQGIQDTLPMPERMALRAFAPRENQS